MDNRRLFLAALLSMLVLVVWQFAFPPEPPRRPPAEAPVADSPSAEAEVESRRPAAVEEPADAAESAVGETTEATEPTVERIAAEVEQEISIAVGDVEALLTNRGGQLLSFRRPAHEGAQERVEMVRERADEPWPFAWVDEDGRPLPLNDVLFAVERRSVDRGEEVELRYAGPEGSASKRFVFQDDGIFVLEAAVDRLDEEWGLWMGPGLRNPSFDFLDDRFQTRGAVFGENGDIDSVLARKAEEPESRPAGGYEWVGLEDTYFLTAFIPDRPLLAVNLFPYGVEAEEGTVVGERRLEPGAEAEGPRLLGMVLLPGRDELVGRAYWGAKNYDRLVELDANLERTVRWGFLRPLARLMQIGVNWIHDTIVSNYGWAIVLMTLLIRIVLLPLMHKSQTSMQKMQKLNPQMEAIRKKYRPKLRDKQGKPDFEMQRKMNEEMQELFRKEGVNPAGGCLPILLQLPVFFSFYYLLRGAVELWHAPWIGWIEDLSAPDPYFVLPIVMGVTQLAQTKMMPPAPNPAQRFILTSMPIWFTIFALGFPSGLVLYWLTNNVLTIIQTGSYNRLKKAGYFGGPDPEPNDDKKPGKREKR